MANLVLPITEIDHIQGSLNAPVVLLEYGDYQCLNCKLAAPIISMLQKELGPKLCFCFRHFPLQQSHPLALMAAKTAEAASQQNKFWEMHNLLYANQSQLNEEIWLSLSETLQLNGEKFKMDFQSPETLKIIENDFNFGVRSGVNGTPCFYINGVRYDGDPSYETFKNALIQAAFIPRPYTNPEK